MVLTQPQLSRANRQAEVDKMRTSYKAPIAVQDVPAIVDCLAGINNGKQRNQGRLRTMPTATKSLAALSRRSFTRFPALVFIAICAAVTSLAACSEKTQSLSDYIAAICSRSFSSSTAAEAPYLAENVSAMTKMMIDMGIRPTGDVDSDFVEMMVPHHRGAIEMAQAELRYGHNEQLRRMAQEIIVTQQQEIAAMRLALGQSLPPSVSSPDQVAPASRTDSEAKRLTYFAKEP